MSSYKSLKIDVDVDSQINEKQPYGPFTFTRQNQQFWVDIPIYDESLHIENEEIEDEEIDYQLYMVEQWSDF